MIIGCSRCRQIHDRLVVAAKTPRRSGCVTVTGPPASICALNFVRCRCRWRKRLSCSTSGHNVADQRRRGRPIRGHGNFKGAVRATDASVRTAQRARRRPPCCRQGPDANRTHFGHANRAHDAKHRLIGRAVKCSSKNPKHSCRGCGGSDAARGRPDDRRSTSR